MIVLCCHIPCNKKAEYEIVDGDKDVDVTYSCKEHLSDMLRDGSSTISPINFKEGKD